MMKPESQKNFLSFVLIFYSISSLLPPGHRP
jgi:hypothetical protein